MVSLSNTPRDTFSKGALDNKDMGMGYLGPIPMEFVAPGGVRVVTIETPTDSYPGTDFVNAFFTVSINPYLTKGECEQFTDYPLAARKQPGKRLAVLGLRGLGSALVDWAIKLAGPTTMVSQEAFVMNLAME